jgi:VWFA-related protein
MGDLDSNSFFVKWKCRPTRRTGEILIPILLFVIAIPCFSQSSDDTIRVETELTAVEVTVSDRDGKPVKGLSVKDFRLFENGKRTEISFFEPVVREDNNRPISIVFALDVSGSVTPEELAILRVALLNFVGRLRSIDSYFALLTFGMEVKTLQEFTNRPEKIKKASERLLKVDDGLSTHAYDAVDFAVRMLAKKSPKTIRGKFPKRAVILVTDGFPVGDTISAATAIERANAAETSVYSVILPSYSRLQGKKKPLPTLLETSGLMEKTGGKSFYANENKFEKLFESLAVEITSSYVLAFYPSKENAEGEFHDVSVESVGGYRIRQNRTRYRKQTVSKPRQ